MALASFMLTEVALYASIFDKPRKWLATEVKLLEKGLKCRMCIGFWATLAVGEISRLEVDQTPSFMALLAVWAGGYLIGSLKDKYAPCETCKQNPNLAQEFKVTK